MNRVKGLFAVLLLVGLFSAAALMLINPREKDVLRYRQLMQSTVGIGNQETKTYVAKQQRSGVSKEIFYEDPNGAKLRMRIQSDNSDIIFNRQEGATEIFEKLHHVVCCMQEEIFYKTTDGKEVEKGADGRFALRGGPSDRQEMFDEKDILPQQLVRYIEADEALYNFHTQTLIASHPQVARYLLPGHNLPENFEIEAPMMEGVAAKVTVSIVNSRLTFSASGLKAKLYAPRTVP